MRLDFKSELIRGSFFLFIMMGVYNLINYFFHFIGARLLHAENYGILATLMSLIYIFCVPIDAVQTIISRYTSKYNVENKPGKIRNLLFRSINKGFKFGFLAFLLFIPLAFFLSYFLNISAFLILVSGLSLFFIFTIPVIRGVMQGSKKFKSLGASMITEAVIKLVFAIALILIGLEVYGAMSALLLGFSASFLMSFVFIKDILKSKDEDADIKGIYSYSFPVVTTTLLIMLMFSLDIIFAKRFFSPELAGQYSVASMIGKMVFLVVSPIAKVMFPIASEKTEKKIKSIDVLKKSLFIVTSICVISILAFLIFPNLIITILFGKEYVLVSSILYILGIAFSLLALSNLILVFILSKHKIKKAYLLFILPIVQIILFYFFHSNIMEFALSFLASSVLPMIISVILLKKYK